MTKRKTLLFSASAPSSRSKNSSISAVSSTCFCCGSGRRVFQWQKKSSGVWPGQQPWQKSSRANSSPSSRSAE